MVYANIDCIPPLLSTLTSPWFQFTELGTAHFMLSLELLQMFFILYKIRCFFLCCHFTVDSVRSEQCSTMHSLV